MEILRNTPGSRQKFAEIDSAVGGPPAPLRCGMCARLIKSCCIDRIREGRRVTAQIKRTEHSRSDAQARTSQRQSDQRTIVAVLPLSEAQDAAVSWSPRSARKKEELDKPAKTLSDVIQLQNCSTHASNWYLGARSRPRDRRSC